LFHPRGQGFPVLHSASWAHVPTGCSKHSVNNDAYFNSHTNGVNEGGWIPVCSGPEAVSSDIVAHIEPLGSHRCSTTSVSAEECLDAVRLFHPRGQGFPVLHSASWAHVPTGCSKHRENHDAYFNSHTNGVNEGGWMPVCSGVEAVPSDIVAHLEAQGSHRCSTASVSAEECLEAVGLFAPDGQFPVLHEASWAHVPTGCSKHSGNHDAYFNSHTNGVNEGGWIPVCSGPEFVQSDIVAHLEAQGSHTCSTSSVSAEECLEAVGLFAPDGQFPVLHSASWAHVPTGCSKHSGNHDAYFNSRANGVNEGGWIPVCNGIVVETPYED